MVALTATLDKTTLTGLFAVIIVGVLLFRRQTEPSESGKMVLTGVLILAILLGCYLTWASAY